MQANKKSEEKLVQGVFTDTKSATKNVIGMVFQVLNEQEIDFSEFQNKVPPENLVGLTRALEEKNIVSTMGIKVLKEMLATGKTSQEIIREQELEQVSDTKSLEPIVEKIINNNAKIVADYKGGKESALQALIGQVMRESKGKSNPQIVRQLLVKLLK